MAGLVLLFAAGSIIATALFYIICNYIASYFGIDTTGLYAVSCLMGVVLFSIGIGTLKD